MDLEVQNRVDEAISDFVVATEGLKSNSSQDTAEEACLTCRDAVQLFFFSRDEYRIERPDKVKELVNCLDDAASALKELSDEQGSNYYVAQYLESVLRRKDLVDAVNQGNAAKIKDLLQEGWEAAQPSLS